ncbi:M48 family metallopeptidase [Sphingopyxis sp.]|uniref:tetratricopeptide repeat protein n=1 Tax=Sphingopyxis sp. TaxID=1908224 RepID=UPI0026038C9D|nr:tetratricopeptide repeat protein [Sphingopyxis sp.]MCW0199537.1 tetratricopeptide repeat protein [Sphingopyxis sp.]
MDRTTTNQLPGRDDDDRIIAAEHERLRTSPLFTRSPVLSRLLQFLVEHRLSGGRSAPKAYAIATEALGRNADFDPAVDSYPRVMVGRLRTLLDRYYAETAWVHRLRVPQGSYEIVVQRRTSPPARPAAGEDEGAAVGESGESMPPSHPADRTAPARRSPGFRWLWIVPLVLLALAAGWWASTNWGRLTHSAARPVPLLEISIPQSGDTPVSRALSRALESRLRDGLRRFDLVDLRSAGPAGAAASARADYRLDASIVRMVDGPADVTLVLNRVGDQRTIWSQQFHLTKAEMPEFAPIDPAIAQVAGDFGIIVRDQVQQNPDDFAPGYPCLAQFNRIRQMRNPQGVRQIDACLRATLDRKPNDPVALNALSLLRFGDWQARRNTPEGAKAFAEAKSLALRAYENGAGTAAGLFAMARANFYGRNCASGLAMGDGALRLNPYDADLAGFMGLFKLACGHGAEGEQLLQRSLDLDASYPGVPAVTLAFVRSQAGDQDEAMAILDRVPSPSKLEPQFLLIRSIVLARQGHLPEARAGWQRLLAFTKQPANAAPEAVLGQFMITPAVIERASAAVRESGILPPAP